MAAFGGLTVLEIDKNGAVGVRRLNMDRSGVADLVANTHLYCKRPTVPRARDGIAA